MSEEKLSLHIDTDWKKQAQEEKRKLAEEQAKKAAAAAAAPATSAQPLAPPLAAAAAPRDQRGASPAAGGRALRGEREIPQASFSTLVNSVMTQVLYYLGDLSQGEGAANLDMAKHQLDTLGMLEEKTTGNLTEDEQKLLDLALYETRSRYIGVASQYVNF